MDVSRDMPWRMEDVSVCVQKYFQRDNFVFCIIFFKNCLLRVCIESSYFVTPSLSTVILEHAFLLFFAACDEGCTADLMKELDDLSNMTRQVNLTGKLPVPWNQLWIIQNETILLKVEISLIFHYCLSN